MILACSFLGHITLRRLHQTIRNDAYLQAYVVEVAKAVDAGAFDKLTRKQIEDDLASRALVYKSDALDALHDLATMPIDDNSAQNQIKLAAAARLVGPGAEAAHASTDTDAILRQLQEEYHRSAPRIKEIRERIVVMESGEAERPAIEP